MASIDPILPLLRSGWEGVELGVADGHSAAALLAFGVRRLYLVDPWCDYDGYLERSDEKAMEFCLNQLRAYDPSRWKVLRMASAEAIPLLPDGLDFIWIDANHRYEWVKSDCEMSWSKVRPGGVLCGHDYCISLPTCEVKKAVDEFAADRSLAVMQFADCWAIVK